MSRSPSRRAPSRRRRSRRPEQLRAALVKIPFLAKPDAASGQLKGVAPDLAEELARRLGLPYQPMAFEQPNAGIAALRGGAADITFLAPTPERVVADRLRSGLHGNGDDPARAGGLADQQPRRRRPAGPPDRRLRAHRGRGDAQEEDDQGHDRARADLRLQAGLRAVEVRPGRRLRRPARRAPLLSAGASGLAHHRRATTAATRSRSASPRSGRSPRPSSSSSPRRRSHRASSPARSRRRACGARWRRAGERHSQAFFHTAASLYRAIPETDPWRTCG